MLASDNSSGVHPKILQALLDCNSDSALPYGEDPYTKKALEKFKEVFGEQSETYFVQSGTAANVLALGSILQTFEAVISAETAHINTDECGALERFTGSKILQIPSKNGKIAPSEIKKTLTIKGNEHRTQPRVISISQLTELGTVYTINEIRQLADFAHENDLLLHVDGARISNAAVTLGVNFKEMISHTGVDLLSFGGTKNGMMYGEAIVSFNPKLTENLNYIRKQGMQLLSKMRYASAQFLAFLEDDLWLTNAHQANKMAKLLAEQVKTISEVEITEKVAGNMLFAKIPREWQKPLQEKNYFYVLDEEASLVRWVTSYNTTESEVLSFAAEIKQLSNNYTGAAHKLAFIDKR